MHRACVCVCARLGLQRCRWVRSISGMMQYSQVTGASFNIFFLLDDIIPDVWIGRWVLSRGETRGQLAHGFNIGSNMKSTWHSLSFNSLVTLVISTDHETFCSRNYDHLPSSKLTSCYSVTVDRKHLISKEHVYRCEFSTVSMQELFISLVCK